MGLYTSRFTISDRFGGLYSTWAYTRAVTVVHDSVEPPVWSRREEPNMSESSLPGWAAVLGFAALTLGPFGLARAVTTVHPPDWIQTNLASRRRTKPVDLIVSCTQGVKPRGDFTARM